MGDCFGARADWTQGGLRWTLCDREVAVVWFGVVMGAALAAEPVSLDVELARDLGDGLFASGDATGALQWYRVARWLEPSGEDLAGIQMRVAMGLEATGDFAGAADWYQRVDGRYTEVAALRTAVCRFRIGSPTWGAETLAELRQTAPDRTTESLLLEGALWLEVGEADQAARALASIPTNDPQGATAAGLAARAGAVPLGRSPGVAAALSVVPGAGQMYAGSSGAGWRNLLVAGAWGGGTWMMLRMGTQGEAWAAGTGGAMLALGGVGWSVNVVDAWRSADAARTRAVRAHADAVQTDVREAFPELALTPSPEQLLGN